MRAKIIAIREVETPEFVYDLEIEDNHNFFADGVLVHNCHRASAPVFSSVIRKFNSAYRLGVSGTVKRADELEWIFFSHIGPPDVTMERTSEYKVSPIVHMVPVPYTFNASEFTNRYTGQFDLSKFITRITKDGQRNNFIVNEILRAIEAGRKTIVFSDRREHLSTMSKMLCKKAKVAYKEAFLVGGVKEEEREKAQHSDVLFCTYSYAAEGLDIPHLDAAFLTTPRSRVQQAVGRLERVLPGKKTPIVVDYVDDMPVPSAQASKRLTYYRSRGFEVKW